MKIAFIGKAGSGKTTCANYLVAKYSFVRLSFAAKVKEFFNSICLQPVEKRDENHRRFLQHLGNGARKVDQKIWIKWLGFNLVLHDEAGRNIVVDDCRYLNEGFYLRDKGFILIRLKGRGYKLSKKLAEHPSETEVDTIPCDYTVNNSVSLALLIKKLDALLKKISRSAKAKHNLFYVTYGGSKHE